MSKETRLYQPSTLQLFLDTLGTKAKKSLSQNFLIDGNIIRKIVKGAEVTPNDLVLEIGPGPGALTEELLAAGAKIIAVEKDSLFAEALKRFEEVTVFNEDILEFALEAHFPEGPLSKVIANLPYHLTTPILIRLLPLHTYFSTITVMVQEEVARRLVAKPKSKEYSAISLFVSFFSDPSYQFKVSRHSFHPAPSVDSAIVTFKLKTPPQVNLEVFFKMTRTAFGKRRKMLKSSLKELYPAASVEEGLQKLNLSKESRPEVLSLKQFLELFAFLQGS